MLYELLYSSFSEREMDADALMSLLESARTKNERLNVTGLLLYCNREYMQLIEGEEEVIRSLWKSIQSDSRHYSTRVMYEGPIEKRGFAGWSMGFRNLSNVNMKALPGYSSFLDKGFTSEILAQNPSSARQLLESVSEVAFE